MPATRLVVAQVRGLHGLQGVVRVEVLTDRPEVRFAVGQTLHREGTDVPLTIVESAAVEDGPGWRLRFREIHDRAASERLREAYLEAIVDRDDDLEPGAAYWHEVVGSEVRGLDGLVLGTVIDIYRVATAEVFVVRGDQFGEFDVPLVKDIVRVFAPDRGEIVVDETALDLAGPVVDEPRLRAPRRRPRWSKHGKGRASTGTPAGSEELAPGALPAPATADHQVPEGGGGSVPEVDPGADAQPSADDSAS
ncbi:MAG: ribosome maturation factor RimM [Chloroflexota bacterium]